MNLTERRFEIFVELFLGFICSLGFLVLMYDTLDKYYKKESLNLKICNRQFKKKYIIIFHVSNFCLRH